MASSLRFQNTPDVLDYNNKITGIRNVGHYSNGKDCIDCYMTNTFPCLKCRGEDEIKTSTMSWTNFLEKCDHDLLNEICTTIPTSYQEFCHLYDLHNEKFRNDGDTKDMNTKDMNTKNMNTKDMNTKKTCLVSFHKI